MFGLFSSYDIRIVAIMTMLLDHVGLLLAGTVFYYPLRMIGRIAFPLFCFLLVEGYIHTKDLHRYMLRLFVCAVVSQVPSSLFLNTGRLNVMYELFIGLICLYLVDRQSSYGIIAFVGLLVACGASCGAEYGLYGIALIVAMYYFRGSPVNRFWFCGILCILMSWEYYGAAALSMAVIWCYDGNVGKRMNRWLQYAIYPLHMILLSAVRFIF